MVVDAVEDLSLVDHVSDGRQGGECPDGVVDDRVWRAVGLREVLERSCGFELRRERAARDGRERGRLAGAARQCFACGEHRGRERQPPAATTRRAHAVRSASVGESRAARIAGSSPAIVPIAIAAAIPPAHAAVGITIAQCLVWA